MIYLVESNDLKNTFGVEEFTALEGAIDTIAPSLLEYHLESLISYSDEATTFNRFNVEHTIDISKFRIYLDYEKRYYLEKDSTENEFESASLF